mmetsp:Transcript_28837/g.32026  ORF Transcript_28837/g.32026 Transcript_28837/m.32026 type:complete len:225 (-) Transcript_28837:169-843(-)
MWVTSDAGVQDLRYVGCPKSSSKSWAMEHASQCQPVRVLQHHVLHSNSQVPQAPRLLRQWEEVCQHRHLHLLEEEYHRLHQWVNRQRKEKGKENHQLQQEEEVYFRLFKALKKEGFKRLRPMIDLVRWYDFLSILSLSSLVQSIQSFSRAFFLFLSFLSHRNSRVFCKCFHQDNLKKTIIDFISLYSTLLLYKLVSNSPFPISVVESSHNSYTVYGNNHCTIGH